ncbi:MAG: hypothetical protein ACK4MV_07885 [Beijerinckiaceae bacterium]
MKLINSIGRILAVSLGVTSFALAQESSFSQSPYTGAAPRPELYATLGDIMGLTQIRHEKLWHAGRAQNWELAAYEIQQIRSTLVRSAALYLNIPIELVVAADAPLEDMLKAVKTRDEKAFVAGYAQLTAACNSCHQAGGVGYVRMVIPRTSSFTNQDFTPLR